MTSELARRFVVTIGTLLVFRLGSHIPVGAMWIPGGPPSSGALVRLSVFSLNLGPYLSAAIFGAVYLVAVWLIPETFAAFGGILPYKFSGGSALIVVCTILDIQKQVRDVSLTDKGGGRR